MPIPTECPVVEKPPGVQAAEQAEAEARLAQEQIDEAVLFRGVPIEARLRDGSTRRVRVRLLSISELATFLAQQDDEPAIIRLTCGAPATEPRGVLGRLWRRARVWLFGPPREWVHELTPDSHYEILGKARQINFRLALRWMESQEAQVRRTLDILRRAEGKASPSPAPASGISSASGPTR
jgi:hypothetical protein